VVTYSKSSRPVKAKFGSVPSPASEPGPRSTGGTDANRGWTGGEFTPASRLPASDQSHARTKRYSSQRLRNVAADSRPSDTTTAAAADGPPASLGVATQLVNATSLVPMPSRPIPGSAFYGTQSILCI